VGFELSDDRKVREKQAVIVVSEEERMIECIVCTEPYPSEALTATGRCVDCKIGTRDEK